MKKPTTKTIYHVFSNNVDEYFTNLKEASKIFIQFKKEYGCSRLYKQNLITGEDGLEEIDDENCLKSYGEWPM